MAHVSTDLGLVIQHSKVLGSSTNCKKGGTAHSKTHIFLKDIVGAEFGIGIFKEGNGVAAPRNLESRQLILDVSLGLFSSPYWNLPRPKAQATSCFL